jgi:sorting nexin-29
MEVFKYGGTVLQLRLMHLSNMCWKTCLIPKDWLKAKVISLFKKGNRNISCNYRGISQLDSAYKLYNGILNKILKTISECILLEEQVGFRRGRSTTDAIFTHKQIIEKRREFNKETHIAFIDFEKAFDNVNRRILWNVMEKRGFPRHLTGAIGSLYHNSSIILDLDGKLTKTITTNKGVRQGCCLSAILCNIYIDDMLRTWKDQIIPGIRLNKNTCISYILCADDMVIIQESEVELQRGIFKLKKIKTRY